MEDNRVVNIGRFDPPVRPISLQFVMQYVVVSRIHVEDVHNLDMRNEFRPCNSLERRIREVAERE